MFKVKLSQLAELTDTYSYGGNGYELKVTQEEDGEKYIEVSEIDMSKELAINFKKHRDELNIQVNKLCKKSISKSNCMYISEIEQLLDNMKYYIREYNGLKGDEWIMKTKIISILIGMGIMGVLVGCGQAIQNVQAGENGYLKYCGSQTIFNDIGKSEKRVEIYEDTEHNKVVYVSIYQGYNVSITVTDNNSKQK